MQQWGCFVLSPRTALSRPQRALGTVLGTWPRAESGGVAFSLSQTQIKRPGLGLAASRRANEPAKWVTLTRAEVVLRCGARLGTRLLVLGRPGAVGKPAEPPAPAFLDKAQEGTGRKFPWVRSASARVQPRPHGTVSLGWGQGLRPLPGGLPRVSPSRGDLPPPGRTACARQPLEERHLLTTASPEL